MIRRLLCLMAYHSDIVLLNCGAYKIIGCRHCSRMAERDYETDHVEIWL